MEAQVQGAQGSLFAGDGGGASFTQPPNLKALPEKASQLGFDFDFIFVFQAGSGSGNNGINVCKGSGVCFFFFFFSFGAVSPHLRGWIPTSTSGLWRSRLERMGVGGGRRSGRRELRGGASRKEGLLLAPGSLHWLCRPPTSAPAPVGSPGASSRKPSLTSPTQAKQTGVSTFLLSFISTSSSTAGWASWFTALSSAQHSGDSSRVEHGKGDPVPTLWSSLSTQAP